MVERVETRVFVPRLVHGLTEKVHVIMKWLDQANSADYVPTIISSGDCSWIELQALYSHTDIEGHNDGIRRM